MNSDLTQLLQDFHNRDNDVRYPATDALVRIGAAAVPGLLEKLHDEKRATRVLAIKTLRRIGHPSAVPGLIEALDVEVQVVVEAACYAHIAFADERAVPALLRLLSGSDKSHFPDRIRKVAARALQSIGTPQALAAVEAWRREQTAG